MDILVVFQHNKRGIFITIVYNFRIFFYDYQLLNFLFFPFAKTNCPSANMSVRFRTPLNVRLIVNCRKG